MYPRIRLQDLEFNENSDLVTRITQILSSLKTNGTKKTQYIVVLFPHYNVV
jgi:hypothetical protein